MIFIKFRKMKNLSLFLGICLILLAGSMVLSYENHDYMTNFTVSDTNIRSSGFNHYTAWGLLMIMTIVTLIAAIKKNLTTAIVGLVFGVLMLVYLPFLAIALVFHLSFGKRTCTWRIRYWILYSCYDLSCFCNAIDHPCGIGSTETSQKPYKGRSCRPIGCRGIIVDCYFLTIFLTPKS